MSANNSSADVGARASIGTTAFRALVWVACFAAVTACVSRAEQITSEAEAERFRRLVDDETARRPDPLQFRARAESMIATTLQFRGRVVDERGTPVATARVRVYAFDQLLVPFEFPYFARSTRPELQVSRSGNFRIDDVRAAGLYLEAYAPDHVAAEGASRLYFPDDPALAEDGSRDAPVLFRLRRVTAGEGLVAVHSGARLLPADGEALAVNVRGFDPLAPEPGTGDVEIRCRRPAPEGRQRPFTWSCTLAVPGGGVQPERLQFDEAPTLGYEPVFTLTRSAGETSWEPRASRDLVLRFADGTVGRYTFSIRLEGRDYVSLDGVWNPSGGRALR